MKNETQKQKTRARVVELLRRGRKTVDELAAALGLTDNAVRMHLAGLERDGVVRTDGVRRSGTAGKPATIYEIAPTAETSFSRAYPPALSALVDVLSERLSSNDLATVMREVGSRMAATEPPPTGNLLKRVKAASTVLNQLGAVTTVDSPNGHGVLLCGASCPLSEAVRRRAEVCQAVQELVSVLTGATVTERCERGARPACRFHISEASS